MLQPRVFRPEEVAVRDEAHRPATLHVFKQVVEVAAGRAEVTPQDGSGFTLSGVDQEHPAGPLPWAETRQL